MFLLLWQASRAGRNVVRDSNGCVHLGQTKTVKRLFARTGAGTERYAKSESLPSQLVMVHRRLGCTYMYLHLHVHVYPREA